MIPNKLFQKEDAEIFQKKEILHIYIHTYSTYVKYYNLIITLPIKTWKTLTLPWKTVQENAKAAVCHHRVVFAV